MGLSMFSSSGSPIAFDFGMTSLKVLQITQGDEPEIAAAAELTIPEPIRGDTAQRMAFCQRELPKLLRSAGFKGKSAVFSVPCSSTFIQHMQLYSLDGLSMSEQVKSQLQTQLGCDPNNIVVRTTEVAPVHRDGQALTETICFAIPRETVMQHIELLKRCRLQTKSVHVPGTAIVHAFSHLNRRDEDDSVATMYVDMGYSGTRVAIAHGNDIVFARRIPIGGMHFDQQIASALNSGIPTARAKRLALQGEQVVTETMRVRNRAPQAEGMAYLNAAENLQKAEDDAPVATDDRRGNEAPAELGCEVSAGELPDFGPGVDISELLDILADELSMSIRYHKGLFSGRAIDRVIFLGGEARQLWLCQNVVRSLQLPAQMGDPLVRLSGNNPPATPGLSLHEPQPGWAVACGLCAAPLDS